MIRRLRDRHRVLVVICALVALVAVVLAYQTALEREAARGEITEAR